MDVEGVKEKFGVAPEQIIDYLALMGDSSDNIPGVPGIGPKTASGLLVGVNGGLTELYAQLDIVPTLPIRGAKTLPAKLEEHKEMAFLSYQLATIKVDVPLDIGLDDLRMGEQDPAKLYELYTLLEFKSWLNDLDRDAKRLELSGAAPEPEPAVDLFSAAEAEGPAVTTQAQYETILDQARFDAWLGKLNDAKLFAFDTETTGIDAQQAQLVGLSFAVQANEAAYIPLTHSYIGVPQQLDRDTVLRALKPILEDPDKLKIGQHAKFDMNILANCAIGGDQANGITVRGIAFDTMLESYVLNSTATRHDMDSLALKYLDHTTVSFQDIAGKGVKQLTFDQIALEQAGPYAAEDADITLRLHQALFEKLNAIPSLASVLTDIEMPLVPVLARIERQGAFVDAALLGVQHIERGEKMEGAFGAGAFGIAG